MAWDIMATLAFIGQCVTIERPNGNLENVYIKNILLDRLSHEIKEILNVENRGQGKECLLKPGKDLIIRPTNEDPIIKPVDSHQTIEELAGDSNG